MTRFLQTMLGLAALLCSATYAFRTFVEAGLACAKMQSQPQRAPQGDWAKPAHERANYRREIAKHGEPQYGGTGI